MRIYHPIKSFCVVLLLLAGALLGQPVHGQEQDKPPNQQNRKAPGLDVIILVDESETMWNTTDPEGIRVNTVNYFIDVLNLEQSTDGHRLAIIPFGSQPRIIPYILLNSPEAAESLKQQYQAVHQSIEPTKDLQYTDLNEALRAALTLLEHERDPTRKPAIILISDGQPTNPRISEEKGRDVVETYLTETQSLLEQLDRHEYASETCSNTNGVPFFTIGMGIDKLEETSSPEFIALYRQFWQGAASRSNGYYREAARLQEMQGISTYIFSELLCTPATPPLTFRESQTLEYQVYSNYYQIIFTISGKDNPDLIARIYRPNEDGTAGGNVLEKDEEGISWQGGPDYEVWRVSYTKPWTGVWRVTLEGDGQAEFSYVIFPNVAINLKEPNSGFLPVDRPVTIRANITDENGQLIDVPVNDFQVAIEGQNLRKTVGLEKEGDDYATQLEALGQTGEYSLTFSTILPDGSPLFEHKWVTLISAPWAELVAPTKASSYTLDETIPLEAKVHLEGAIPLDGVKMTATLQKQGKTVQTIELSRGDMLDQSDEERVVAYSGAFQPVEEPGDYEVQTQLMAILPGGRVFDLETSPVALSVTLPPTPTPSPTLTPSPTATPTSTPLPVAVVAPAIPTAVPTLAPASVFGSSGVLGSSYLPCLALLLLLLLLALLVFLWRRRREEVPDKIKLLARLMKSRQENSQQPYLLVLGSGDSLMLGSRSMRQIVESVTSDHDLEKFHKTLDSFSPIERYSLLKKHFDEVNLSPGYRRLAKLVDKGFFDLVFTTNLDPFVEKSLPNSNGSESSYQVLICGTQRTAETLEQIEQSEPRVKIVKLHGDVGARTFAFTPSEVSTFGGDSERLLRHYLCRDVIIIGHGPRDYDINRAIEPKGGSIWYINQTPPLADGPLFRAMRARRAEANIIDGEFGEFDRFFEALYKELVRS